MVGCRIFFPLFPMVLPTALFYNGLLASSCRRYTQINLVSIQMIPKDCGFRNENLVSANSADPPWPKTLGSTCSSRDADWTFPSNRLLRHPKMVPYVESTLSPACRLFSFHWSKSFSCSPGSKKDNCPNVEQKRWKKGPSMPLNLPLPFNQLYCLVSKALHSWKPPSP